MSDPGREASSPGRRTLSVMAASMLVTVLATALGFLLPAVLGSSTPGSSAAVASLAALAMAALLVLAVGLLMLGARHVSVAVAAGERPPPVLTGRANDPVHHPLRPRAPGLA